MSRRSILNLVAEERYDQAIDDLKAYLDSLPEYPAFKERAERFATYGIELIQAIRAKRSFPGWSTLNMSKQRDLVERAIHHFEDLKATLTKMEMIEREARIEDVRSTVWVVKSVVYAATVLLVLAFVKEATGEIIPSLSDLFESSINWMVDFIFDKTGL
jgi:flagellar biosynthesis protein FlhB